MDHNCLGRFSDAKKWEQSARQIFEVGDFPVPVRSGNNNMKLRSVLLHMGIAFFALKSNLLASLGNADITCDGFRYMNLWIQEEFVERIVILLCLWTVKIDGTARIFLVSKWSQKKKRATRTRVDGMLYPGTLLSDLHEVFSRWPWILLWIIETGTGPPVHGLNEGLQELKIFEFEVKKWRCLRLRVFKAASKLQPVNYSKRLPSIPQLGLLRVWWVDR